MKYARTRKTEDLCSDCWYETNPTEYFPQTDRFATCHRCGYESLVARSPIVDEVEVIGPDGTSVPSASNNVLANPNEQVDFARQRWVRPLK